MKYCFVLLILFAVGCSLNPVTPSGPVGTVSGYTHLYDAASNPLASSSGITVTETVSGRSAETNDSGKWVITGLPAGKKTFTISKTGFGTMKVFDFQTNGKDTVLEETDIAQPSSDQINFQRLTISLSVFDSVTTYNIIGAMQPPFIESRSVVLCISADSAALAQDPSSATVLLEFTKSGSGYDGGFNWSSSNALDIHKDPFPYGTKLYAAICVAGVGPNAELFSNYFDTTLNKQIYTALGKHSQILSVVKP